MTVIKIVTQKIIVSIKRNYPRFIYWHEEKSK